MEQPSTPAKVGSMDELGPLPKADGAAETNKERHPEGGYTFDEVDAWSEPLVRAYAAAEVARAVAAERERCAVLAETSYAEHTDAVQIARFIAVRIREAHVTADMDIIAEHSGKTKDREWHSVGCWLRPGEVLAHTSKPKA